MALGFPAMDASYIFFAVGLMEFVAWLKKAK